MNDKLSFCLEITNWCNLNCAHCCNMSGPKEPRRIMPLATAQKLITQFNDIDFPRTEHICIGGGEAMAPYIFGDHEYLPRVTTMIYDAGAIPTIKTNAVWGKHKDLRQSILKGLTDTAYKYQILTTLDISLDEFHKNIDGVANIVSSVVKSDYIRPAIRIVLVGFNTPASIKKLDELQTELKHRELEIIKSPVVSDDTKYDFGAAYRGQGIMVFSSFETPIYNDGRAEITGVATTGPSTGMTSVDGNCLVVNNMDTAILNYKYREHIAGRDLNTVVRNLMTKMYTQGR